MTVQTTAQSDIGRFDGTQSYIATEDLKVAVNAAVTLRRPLLVKG
ncbi:MAG: ATP-binding protein, partial [Allopontixanthobacter sp.]|nr:ATP-binding protein [Allopontixanthobacter sp.]